MTRMGRTILLAAASLAAVLLAASLAAAPPAAMGQAEWIDEGDSPAPLPGALKDPYAYVERYNTDESFREWFDKNHASTYASIYEAAGVPEPAPFVEAGADPMSYVERYNTDEAYRKWFDVNYGSAYASIYEAGGLPEPAAPAAPSPAPRPAPAAPAIAPHPDFAMYAVDPGAGPYTYVERYRSDASYRAWFDSAFAGMSIYEAVGVPEPAPFAAGVADPQELVVRYENEESYRQWYDATYGADYPSFHSAVGLPTPKPAAPFVDPDIDPRYYVARYDSEPEYRAWFEESFPGYTIYEAVGIEESEAAGYGQCGIGTSLVGGKCVPVKPPPPPREGAQAGGSGSGSGSGAAAVPQPAPSQPSGGGCLVATAAYGTEMAPQVQMLRELRDGVLLETAHGASFMQAFSAAYYSFSPAVADMEREAPALRAAVAALLAPMLASLSIMSAADSESPGSVLAAGTLVIALNAAAYAGAPAAAAAWAAGRIRRGGGGGGPGRPHAGLRNAGVRSDGQVV